MSNTFNRTLFVLALVFTLCNLSCGPALSGVEKTEFSLESIKGDTISLSDYKGRNNILLTFWTTWCPYCVTELKELGQMYPELKSNGFEILAVNVQENKTKVENFISTKGIQFPVLLDLQGTVAKNYGVRGIPAVFIIDKQGEIKASGNSVPSNYLEMVK